MTSCAHGVRFDRYCPDCEKQFTVIPPDLGDTPTYDTGRAGRLLSGTIAAACILAALLVAAAAVWRTHS